MAMTLKVTYVDGVEKTYPLTARIEVEVERRFQLALQDCRHREHTYYAAWIAQGKEGGFEELIDKIVTAEFVNDEEAKKPDPTGPGGSANSSS
jgi:hypothetical protein